MFTHHVTFYTLSTGDTFSFFLFVCIFSILLLQYLERCTRCPFRRWVLLGCRECHACSIGYTKETRCIFCIWRKCQQQQQQQKNKKNASIGSSKQHSTFLNRSIIISHTSDINTQKNIFTLCSLNTSWNGLQDSFFVVAAVVVSLLLLSYPLRSDSLSNNTQNWEWRENVKWKKSELYWSFVNKCTQEENTRKKNLSKLVQPW